MSSIRNTVNAVARSKTMKAVPSRQPGAGIPSQEGHVHLLDVRDALDRLTAEHREALMLAATGLSYDDAAVVCGCAVGRMKSRTSRARDRLAQMLDHRHPWVGDDSSFSGAPRNANNSEGALAFG